MEAAARHLASRPRSAAELRNYLIKKGFDKEDVEDAILRLKENRYLDDISYACAYIRYSMEKRKAVFRIKYELREKGVSDFDIEEGIYMFEDEAECDISEIEYENAKQEAEKYMLRMKKDREKTARRLYSLGYPSSVIFSVLERYR